MYLQCCQFSIDRVAKWRCRPIFRYQNDSNKVSCKFRPLDSTGLGYIKESLYLQYCQFSETRLPSEQNFFIFVFSLSQATFPENLSLIGPFFNF